MLLVAGLCAVGFGIAQTVAVNQDVGAYARAPGCTTGNPPPGPACVWLESGRVTGRYVGRSGDSTTHNLTVARESDPGGEDYDVGVAFYDDADVGTYVQLKVWKGDVAEVYYRGHKSVFPQFRFGFLALLALLIAVGTSMVIAGLPRVDEDARWMSLVALVPFFFAGWFFDLFFGAVRLPLAVAVAVITTGWLAMTAIAVKLAH
ncbi:hypothetical protein PUR71_01230 [Streptomyces sp. SP17BM10]|uniref:hypothetical protein n=1 Tax=Streptomyces sp. SP17BM10 TaxID=3002530 RepID=UPI002E775F06|nr:hypothetical protein [Streptomyces sp. SP17BM10]MEE1781565.1 hypothetical protein [Streptomyces sp. SP17BM10]